MHMTAQEGDGPTEVPEDQGMLLTLFYACGVHFQRENITLMQGSSLNRTFYHIEMNYQVHLIDLHAVDFTRFFHNIKKQIAPYFYLLSKCLYSADIYTYM